MWHHIVTICNKWAIIRVKIDMQIMGWFMLLSIYQTLGSDMQTFECHTITKDSLIPMQIQLIQRQMDSCCVPCVHEQEPTENGILMQIHSYRIHALNFNIISWISKSYHEIKRERKLIWRDIIYHRVRKDIYFLKRSDIGYHTASSRFSSQGQVHIA